MHELRIGLLAEHLGEETRVLASLLGLAALQLPLELRHEQLEQRRPNRVQLVDDQAQLVAHELAAAAAARAGRGGRGGHWRNHGVLVVIALAVGFSVVVVALVVFFARWRC